MAENPNTEAPLDAEDWEVALEPYAGHHHESLFMMKLITCSSA
jgi:hypothetical protein